MNQFTLQQGMSRELESFPHIKEFALTKNTTIQLDSFPISTADCLLIYCVVDGKFEWIVNGREYILYAGDIAFVLPGQQIGGSKGFLEIGTLFRLHIDIHKAGPDLTLGKWSSLSSCESLSIEKMLLINNLSVLLKVKEGIEILHQIHNELINPEIGHVTRVNHFIDSLLIIIARQSTRAAAN